MNDRRTEEPLALAVSSSTGVMAVGVGQGDRLLSEVTIEAERRHAEEISLLIQQVCAEADCALPDLDRLIVDIGPGRFTGLRVGVATVRALAFALEVPVVGLTCLEILAAGAPNNRVTAVVDARRGEVFQQRFADGAAVAPAVVGKAEELAAASSGLVVGDGYDRYRSFYDGADRSAGDADERQHEQQSEQRHERPAAGPQVGEIGCVPTVAAMVVLAADRTGTQGTEIVPFYLRDPDVNPNVKVRPHG